MQSGDGLWLLTAIGRPCNNTVNCSNGQPQPAPPSAACPVANDSAPHNMESGISMFVAKTLVDGEWAPVGSDGGIVLPKWVT